MLEGEDMVKKEKRWFGEEERRWFVRRVDGYLLGRRGGWGG